MIPRLGQQNLPDNAADVARNCLLLSGELRGLHSPLLIKDFTTDNLGYVLKRAYRLRDDNDDFWVPFDDNLAHFLKGPLVNDKHDRYYIGFARYSAADLERLLKSSRGPAVPVVIRGDREAQHKSIRRVMDICARSGYKRVKFSALKK